MEEEKTNQDHKSVSKDNLTINFSKHHNSESISKPKNIKIARRRNSNLNLKSPIEWQQPIARQLLRRITRNRTWFYPTFPSSEFVDRPCRKLIVHDNNHRNRKCATASGLYALGDHVAIAIAARPWVFMTCLLRIASYPTLGTSICSRVLYHITGTSDVAFVGYARGE